MPIAFQHRVLLYRAAQGLVHKDKLEEAIRSYEASNPDFNAGAFIRHCNNNRAILSLDSETLKTLESKLSELDDGAAAPAARASAFSSPAAAAASAPAPLRPSKPADQTVFEKVLEQVLVGLAPSGADKLKAAFSKSAAGLPPGYAQFLNDWAANPGHPDTSGLARANTAQMKSVIDNVYTTTCGLVGPIKADQIFGRAVREADRLPEAVSFPPKRLM